MNRDDTEYRYDAADGLGADLREGLRDVGQGIAMWRTWLALGLRDFLNHGRRTMLGPLWSIVGTLVTVVALGSVYGALLRSGTNETYPYVAAGLICWFFIAGSLQGGFSVFLNSAGLIKEREIPISFNVFRYTWRLFIEFVFKFVVFAIVAFAVGLELSFVQVLALPALALLFLNGLWVAMLFGVGGARYRDLGEMIGPLMLIAFLATPVLWPQTALASNQFIADWNPLTHYIAIVREPLLGRPAPSISVIVVLALTVAGWAIALPVFAAAKTRLVFWL